MRILAVIWVVGLSLASAAWAQENGTIEVTGVAQVESAPDIATLRFGVVAQAKTGAEAMDQVSAGIETALAQISAAGVDARDVQTSDFALNPIFDYQNQVGGVAPITGYQARNGLVVILRDLAQLGAVLDQLTRDGVNQFQGIVFGVADPEPLLNEARRKAVEKARAKAELFASAAGVELGDLQKLTESQGRMGGGPIMLAEAARDSAAPIAQGEVGFQAEVRMIYEIAQ